MNKIYLICEKEKCPRKLLIERDKTIPEKAVRVVSLCPWHGEEGQMETFFDANDEELLE